MDYMIKCLVLLAAVVASLCVPDPVPDDANRRVTAEGMTINGTSRMYKCPQGFVRSGNSCYFLSRTMASWDDAHYACRARNASLATLELRSENYKMRQFLLHKSQTPLERWIGGMYQPTGQWVWTSSGGTNLTYNSFPKSMVKRDDYWMHCLSMNPRSKYHWRPKLCSDKLHFICETRLKVVLGHDKQNKHHQRKKFSNQKPGGDKRPGGRRGGGRNLPGKDEVAAYQLRGSKVPVRVSGTISHPVRLPAHAVVTVIRDPSTRATRPAPSRQEAKGAGVSYHSPNSYGSTGPWGAAGKSPYWNWNRTGPSGRQAPDRQQQFVFKVATPEQERKALEAERKRKKSALARQHRNSGQSRLYRQNKESNEVRSPY